MTEDNNKTYLSNFEEVINLLNHHACRMPNVRVSFVVKGKMTIDDLQPFFNAIEEVRYYISRSYIGYCVLKGDVNKDDEVLLLYNELAAVEDKSVNGLSAIEKNVILAMPDQEKLNQYVIKLNKFLVDELNKYKSSEKVLGDVVR